MPLYGPKFPLSLGNEDTFKMNDSIEQQISFYLKNLILTSPGENISDPNYGVGLRRFLFEQNIDSSISRIKNEIFSQISKYLPYLSPVEVEIDPNAEMVDDYRLSVKVTYGIPGDVLQKVFELDLRPDTITGFY